MYQAISDLLMRSHVNRRAVVRSVDGIADDVVDDHRRIFNALLDRDQGKADEVLRKHFEIGSEYRRKAAARDGAAEMSPPTIVAPGNIVNRIWYALPSVLWAVSMNVMR